MCVVHYNNNNHSIKSFDKKAVQHSLKAKEANTLKKINKAFVVSDLEILHQASFLY